MRAAVSYLAGFLRDPHTKDGSATRLAGLACIALAGVALVKGCDAAVIATLVTGGAVTFLARTKSVPNAEAPE